MHAIKYSIRSFDHIACDFDRGVVLESFKKIRGAFPSFDLSVVGFIVLTQPFNHLSASVYSMSLLILWTMVGDKFFSDISSAHFSSE